MKSEPASTAPNRDDISRRAYDLWLAAGSPENSSQDHWLQAERDLASPSAVPTGLPVSTTPYSASGSSSISGQGASSSGSGPGGR